MDESGFLLIHNDFIKLESVLDLKKLAQNVGSTHITQAEQSVAADMIKRKLMYRNKCKNFKDITNKNFYVVNITTDAYVDTEQCPKYQIGRVDGTAVYLGKIWIIIHLYAKDVYKCTYPELNEIQMMYTKVLILREVMYMNDLSWMKIMKWCMNDLS